MSETSPPTTSRTRASPAHWCSAASPTSVQPTVRCGSRVSAWLSAADPQPAAPGDSAGVWLQLAGQQAEAGWTSVAVAPDDADARAVVHARA